MTGLADSDAAGVAWTLLELLEPVVAEGNQYAALAAARIIAADDPDAEARAVLAEWWTAVGIIHGVLVDVLRDDPEACWRCNAAKGDGRLGVCPACLTDLQA